MWTGQNAVLAEQIFLIIVYPYKVVKKQLTFQNFSDKMTNVGQINYIVTVISEL